MSSKEQRGSSDDSSPQWMIHNEDRSMDSLPPESEDDLSTQELERLYQQAMNVVDMADAVEDSLRIDEPVPDKYATHEGEPTKRVDINSQQTSPQSSPLVPKMQPIQILEAALFVGGTDLTTKKLGRLLGESVSSDLVETEIATLNQRYADQQRPYHIEFGEGGYRLELKPDFERIRNRVYGLGPKDVKLSQEALEVLAMVAYRQPIHRQDILEKGPKSSGSLLNQLLRRELIVLQRVGVGRNNVEYSTTERFLEVFGIAELKDLPQLDDLSFK